MSLLDFVDKHWGFWFAIFLLCMFSIVGQVTIALLGAVIALFGRAKS